jgi:enoyl-CoA hydratase/carnithine racemase
VRLSEAPTSTVRSVRYPDHTVLQLCSTDGMNRLTIALISSVSSELQQLSGPVVITGNERFFSAGADLNEIAQLPRNEAFDFALTGQRLMERIERHPAPIAATISGYCMGGGLDLALACHLRVASPNAIFGHRGAALGIMTGWGGTQRLSRLVGKPRAMQMFVAAEKWHADEAHRYGLVDQIASDPLGAARALLGLKQ